MRFIGTTDLIRHIFTNEKDSFTLNLDKTVTGNQGSRDKYFEFKIDFENLPNGAVLTMDTSNMNRAFVYRTGNEKWYVILYTEDAPTMATADKYEGYVENDLSSIKKFDADGNEDSSGTWYKYTDGQLTQTAPTVATASRYVGYTVDDLSSIKKYKLENNRLNEHRDGTYYKLKQGEYTQVEPIENVNTVLYQDNGQELTDKPNVATIFSIPIIYNANNHDDNVNMTYAKASSDASIDETIYVFEDAIDPEIKYIYDTDAQEWKKYGPTYVEDPTGPYYKKVYTETAPTADTGYRYEGYMPNGSSGPGGTYSKYKIDYVDSIGEGCKYHHLLTPAPDGTYTLVPPDKYTAINYDGYSDNDLSSITTYDAAGAVDPAGDWYRLTDGEFTQIPPTLATATSYMGFDFHATIKHYVQTMEVGPDGTYYKYAAPEGDYVEAEPTEADASLYEGFNGYQLNTLKRYKRGMTEDTGFDGNVPQAAKYIGLAGQQVVANNEGKASVTIYLKHGESVKFDGLPEGATYKITENEADALDYYTTIKDGNNKNEIVGRVVEGEVGKTAETDPDGEFYKVVSGPDAGAYERPASYYADYAETEDFSTMKKYKVVYSERKSGTYYKLLGNSYTADEPTPATAKMYEDYNGSDTDYSGYKKYRMDFVEDAKGTYYRIHAPNGGSAYKEEAPSVRYEKKLGKYATYRLDVSKRYFNKRGVAIPTEIRENWLAALLLPIALIALILLIRYRRRMAEEDE